MASFLLSGETLPIAPRLTGPSQEVEAIQSIGRELDVFHRKLLDYLRRLTQKLSSAEFPLPGGGGAVPVFSGLLDANFALNSVTFTAIPWKIEVKKDSDFTHSKTVNPANITVVTAGFYVVMVDFGIDLSLSTLFEAKITDIVRGDLSYSNLADFTDGATSIICPMGLEAGDTIKVQCRDASSRNLLKANTRFLMIKLSSSGGSGGGGGTEEPGCNQLWQFCP